MHDIKHIGGGIHCRMEKDEIKSIYDKLANIYAIAKTKTLIEKIEAIMHIFDNETDGQLFFTDEQLSNLIAILAAY